MHFTGLRLTSRSTIAWIAPVRHGPVRLCLPIRFNLQYRSDKAQNEGATKKDDTVDDKKNKIYKEMPNTRAEPDPGMERPVMVHRAMLGSVERMFAILTEHLVESGHYGCHRDKQL